MTASGDAAQVLQERAMRLARPPAPLGQDESVDLLCLVTAGQRCAIELRWLRHVGPLRGLGALPLAPEAVLGLAHWEENILHVLQLSKLLSLPSGQPSHMAVLAVRGCLLALAIDSVEGVIRLPVAQARHESAAIESLRPDVVQGIAEDGTLVLDAERLAAIHAPAGDRDASRRNPKET